MKQSREHAGGFSAVSKSHIPIASGMRDAKVSETLATRNKVFTLRQNGRRVVDFGLGESPFGAPVSLKISLANNAFRTSYLSTEGIPELRASIARFYEKHFGYCFSPDNVVVGPGSKELIFLTMAALDCDWLFPTPSWVSYEAQARILDKRFWRVRMPLEDGYHITKRALQKGLNETDDSKPITILINYPNNPTGLTIPKHEVKRIARFARNNELLILSDEIYANVTHSPFEHHSLALEYPEGTIVTGGISKDRSLGGWRLGVAIYPDELAGTVRALGSETYSCASAPIQYACVDAYSSSDDVEKHIADSTKIHRLIGSVVYDALSKNGYNVARPEGAFYMMPSLDHNRDALESMGIYTSQDMANHLLEKGVAVIPGTAFGMLQSDMVFRLAYVDYDGQAVMNKFRKKPQVDDPELFVKNFCPSVHEGVQKLVDFSRSL